MKYFKGYAPNFYFKKPACTCYLYYPQSDKCPVHSKR